MSGLAMVRPMAPVALPHFGIVCGAGQGQSALLQALRHGESALRPHADPETPLVTWTAPVPGLAEVALPAALAAWDCRATRLAWLGLQSDGFAAAAAQAITRFGAHRVGLVLGTSASTIAVSEAAYRQLEDGAFPARWADPRLNTPHALALFVQQALGLAGPAVTVSTACSSSARAFGQGQRWLALDLVDAVVVGGVDALCASVLYGFHALGLMSEAPCRPFDRRRNGISVGEAAGFALLTRGEAALRLLGFGESNDAHHMSSPHPQGLGAEQALDQALQRAGLPAEALDYVNLHGTATPKNDEVEAALVLRRYAPHTAVSATKGLTGHAMGAAGILEAAICLLALQHALRPGTAHTDAPEAGLDGRLLLHAQAGAVRRAASHSFGFGGNNSVLVFARGDGA